jgi:hypothetical protein
MASVITMALCLAACAGARQGGYASYDALRDARDACAKKGGELTLARNGDPQSISDYACKRK